MVPLVAVVLSACSKGTPGSSSHRTAPQEVPIPTAPWPAGELPSLEPSAPREPETPPALPGDLVTDVEETRSEEECVAKRPPLDPSTGDLLDALGYDTLARDACRMLLAVKEHRMDRCRDLPLTVVQETCRNTVAMYWGEADQCPPWVEASPDLGRNPTCLAVALGDASFCAAETLERRKRCEALARGSEAPCGKGPRSHHCRRDLARWRRALTSRPTRVFRDNPTASFMATPRGEAPALTAESLDLAHDVQGGVVLLERPTAYVALLGQGHASASRFATPRVPGSLSKPSVTARILIPKQGDGGAIPPRLEHLEVQLPGSSVLRCPAPHCDLRVELDDFQPQRGRPLTLRILGEVQPTTGHYGVQMPITTFVRDVVAAGPSNP